MTYISEKRACSDKKFKKMCVSPSELYLKKVYVTQIIRELVCKIFKTPGKIFKTPGNLLDFCFPKSMATLLRVVRVFLPLLTNVSEDSKA